MNQHEAAAEMDRQEILRLHNQWWESNYGCDIPKMREVFAGEQYLMYNLNGHPYYGLSEKTTLWEFYKNEVGLKGVPERRNVRLEVWGDTAWLACEAFGVWYVFGEEGFGTEFPTEKRIGVRATEIYRRDDGEGRPVWKMWHFHCSWLAAEDEKRPGINDTAEEREAAR